MAASVRNSRISASVRALRAAGVGPGIAGALSKDADATARAVYDAVLGEVPAYSASGNPEVLPEFEEHISQHLQSVSRLLKGRQSGDLDFVAEQARRRAEQKFPLDAILGAYRCLHSGLLPWIREAALEVAREDAHVRRVVAAVTEFTAAYTSVAGTLMTSEYVDATRSIAEAEGDRRTELLNTLLYGYDEADPRAAQLLRRSGYLEQRQSYCVAVARSVDPREMLNAARAQRMADAVSQSLSDLPVRVLTGVRDNLVTVVMSGTRRLSGWTAPQSLLADRVYPKLRLVGPAALIGLSSDAPSTAHIPQALSEAKIALDFASVADRVMPYERVPLRSMLVRVAAEQVQSALPAWARTLLDADEKSRGSLIDTLRAYADADMNVLKTAKALSIHPNTIYARMQKIEGLTGRSPLSYNALTEMLLAVDCAKPGSNRGSKPGSNRG